MAAFEYQTLSADDQARIAIDLGQSPGIPVADKVLRILEADHYARTLLGQDTKSIESAILKYRRKPAKP